MRISRFGNQNSELLDSFVKKANEQTQKDETLSFEKIAQQVFEQEKKPTLREILAQIDTPDMGMGSEVGVAEDPLADASIGDGLPTDDGLGGPDLGGEPGLDEGLPPTDVVDEGAGSDEVIKNALIAAVAAAFGPDGIDEAVSLLQNQGGGIDEMPEPAIDEEMPGADAMGRGMPDTMPEPMGEEPGMGEPGMMGEEPPAAPMVM